MKVVKITSLESFKTPFLYPERDSHQSRKAHQANQKIALPTMDGYNFEKVRNIISLEANGNYTILYLTDGRREMVCKTLRDMEAQLKKYQEFVRIHRSFTINLNWIQKYIKGKGGCVVMENGTNIPVSAGKKETLMDALAMYF